MFKTSFIAAAATALLTVLAGCESMSMKPAPAVPMAPTAPALPMNGLLVAPGGMTLYTFDKDTAGSGASACNGPCATLWLPLAASATDAPMGNFTIITREDATRQWAWKGWPLYRYSKDVRAGDTSGDNFKTIWHVIKN